jgi:hypothetical protein
MSTPNPDALSSDPLHPLELYRPSMDYSEFESQIICPFMRSARSYDTLFSETKLAITFAPGRPSIDELLAFLRETDYNSISYPQTPPTPSTSDDVVEVPHIRTSEFLKGYISRRKPDCFIWEAGFFEKGSQVILGGSGRRATVAGLCGLGKNFIMMRIVETGGYLEGEVRICRMVVSARPSSPWIQCLHTVSSRLFKPFLNSMSDFVDEAAMEIGTDNIDEDSGVEEDEEDSFTVEIDMD